MADELGWRRFLRRRAVAVLAMSLVSWIAVIGVITFMRRLATG